MIMFNDLSTRYNIHDLILQVSILDVKSMIDIPSKESTRLERSITTGRMSEPSDCDMNTLFTTSFFAPLLYIK